MTPKATLTRNNNARTPKAAPSRVPTPTLRRLNANALGKRVGLVTTAEIHDASPAAFSITISFDKAFESLGDNTDFARILRELFGPK